MTLSAVASRYANAMADVVTAASSPLRPEMALAELQAFENTLRYSPELQNALVTPAVPAGRKRPWSAASPTRSSFRASRAIFSLF